jgi:hypothetical protein
MTVDMSGDSAPALVPWVNMTSERNYSRATQVVTVSAGGILVSVPFFIDIVIAGPGLPQALRAMLVVTGCAFIVLGTAFPPRRLGKALARVSLAILSSVLLLALAEAAAFDVERLNDPGEDLPI